MIVLGFLLGLVIILQIFVLVGICRTNYKLDELDVRVSTLNDLIVPAISMNVTDMKDIKRNIGIMSDVVIETNGRLKKHKKHKKKKGDTFYADNEPES